MQGNPLFDVAMLDLLEPAHVPFSREQSAVSISAIHVRLSPTTWLVLVIDSATTGTRPVATIC
jgi:hypothetical protein